MKFHGMPLFAKQFGPDGARDIYDRMRKNENTARFQTPDGEFEVIATITGNRCLVGLAEEHPRKALMAQHRKNHGPKISGSVTHIDDNGKVTKREPVSGKTGYMPGPSAFVPIIIA